MLYVGWRVLDLQHKTCWTCCQPRSGLRTLEQFSLLLCSMLAGELGFQHKTCWTCCQPRSGVGTLEQSSLLLCSVLAGQFWIFSAKACWTCCQPRSGLRTLEQRSLLFYLSSLHCCGALCWLDNVGSSAQRRVGRAVSLGQG